MGSGLCARVCHSTVPYIKLSAPQLCGRSINGVIYLEGVVPQL